MYIYIYICVDKQEISFREQIDDTRFQRMTYMVCQETNVNFVHVYVPEMFKCNFFNFMNRWHVKRAHKVFVLIF